MIMRPLKRISFIFEDFAIQSPAQQLLDRFLVGYPRDGGFHRLENCHAVAHLTSGENNPELERRKKDFGLIQKPTVQHCLAGADAAVIVCGESGAKANDDLLKNAIKNLPKGRACFVYGSLSSSLAGAKEIAQLASSRQIALLAGTPLGVTWRLPQVDVTLGTPLKEGIIVVQGKSNSAELEGLEGIMPVIERRKGGEAGIRRIQYLKSENLWRAGNDNKWSWPLLASALSRSDTPQGESARDGRTQDLIGLGLVPKLARDPRGWLIEHRDGFHSAILILDGVITDYNFAVQGQDGSVVSAQIYRPPAPAEQHYSRLADVIEEFFRTGKRPWPLARNVLIAGLLQEFRKHSDHPDQLAETPEMDVSYSL